MNTEKINITEIKINPSNPRTIKGDKFDKLVKSIQEFPKMLEIRPIVINGDNVVLGGNMRLEACKKAGLKEVPVMRPSDLSADEQRQFIIKDNVGFGDWDWDLLANEWNNEDLEEWGLDVWQPEEEVEVEAQEDDYEQPEEVHTDIVLGDLIEIGQHRVLCGDATDSEQVAKLMDGEKADMVFTDPPYDLTDYSWTDYMFMFSHGHQFVLNSEQRNVDISSKHRDLMSRWYAVDFRKAHMISGKQAMTRVDFVSEFRNSEKVRFINRNKGFRTLIESVKHSSKKDDHKQAKNPELPATFIEHHTEEKELILDLFLGSGTTMVACQQLGRKCYGMELDPKYCQVIIDRMLKLAPGLKVKINGKKYTQNETA